VGCWGRLRRAARPGTEEAGPARIQGHPASPVGDQEPLSARAARLIMREARRGRRWHRWRRGRSRGPASSHPCPWPAAGFGSRPAAAAPGRRRASRGRPVRAWRN